MIQSCVKLSEVVTVNPRIPKDIEESQPVSFVAMASVSEDGALLHEETRTLAETKKGFTYFEKSDVLLAKITPCFENGKCLRPSQISNQVGFGSTEFHVLRANPKKIDSTYLFYMIWNEKFRSLGQAAMSGAAGQKRIGADSVKEFDIPLPTITEQKRIATILDKGDALRRKRQKAIQLADQFLRAVFLDMFGDPVTNPKEWDVYPLKALTTKIGSGATPRGGKGVYKETGISLIRSLNIHDDKFIHKDLAFIDDEQAAKLDNVAVEPGDVLLNITGASVCRCSMVDNSVLPARVNQHVCIIRADTELIFPEYLIYLFISKSYKSKLLNLSTSAGATREALTKDQVCNLDIPVPPVKLQQDFKAIKDVINRVVSRCSEIENLPLFNSLSQKAFTGKL